MCVSGDRSRAESDDTDLSRAGAAAETQCEAYARILGVVGSRRASLLVCPEDLRSVFDIAVGEGAQGCAGNSEVLLHSQCGVEVADRNQIVSMNDGIDPENLHGHDCRGNSPEE